MSRPAGRDQASAMERLIRILVSLSDAGDEGLSGRRLGRIAGYEMDTDGGQSALRRDLRSLRAGGWEIVHSAGSGNAGRYVLHARDNRMALLLSPGEHAALIHLLHESAVDLPEPPAHLAELERAVVRHCLVNFSYRSRRRTVHPHTLHNGPSGWMLRGREVATGTVKEYVARWMGSDVEIDAPGSAETPEQIPRRSFDPMTWHVDPLLEVTLQTTPDFEREVCRVMTDSRVVERDGDRVTVVVPVTNRVAFRSRLIELGLRVRVIDPPDGREAVVVALRAVLEAGG